MNELTTWTMDCVVCPDGGLLKLFTPCSRFPDLWKLLIRFLIKSVVDYENLCYVACM